MRRMKVMFKRRDDTVASHDLAIVKDHDPECEAGPDDLVEPFVQGRTHMRLYVRGGKAASKEDIDTVLEWFYCRYLPEIELIEGLLSAECLMIH